MSKMNPMNIATEPVLDLERLVHQIKPKILKYLLRKVPPSDVDDLFQDICLKVITSIHTLRDPKRLMPWVYSVACSRIKDYYRSFNRCETTDIEDWEGVVDDRGRRFTPEEKLALKQLRECIFTLKGNYQQVAVLHFIAGYPPREISSSLMLNIHTVKSLIQRSKTHLLTMMVAQHWNGMEAQPA